MREQNRLRNFVTRLSHPLWAMLIAAAAAIGAIAQCGFMLDAAADGARGAGTAAGSPAVASGTPAERLPVAAATRAIGSSELARPN